MAAEGFDGRDGCAAGTGDSTDDCSSSRNFASIRAILPSVLIGNTVTSGGQNKRGCYSQVCPTCGRALQQAQRRWLPSLVHDPPRFVMSALVEWRLVCMCDDEFAAAEQLIMSTLKCSLRILQHSK